MPVQIIGMIQPHEVSETIPRKGPAIDPAYVRAFAQAHEYAGLIVCWCPQAPPARTRC